MTVLGTVHAPAKINLGLDVLGRRPDGFHEIRSVVTTASLADTLTFHLGDVSQDRLTVDGDDDVPGGPDNLVLRVVAALREAGATIPPLDITLGKRIPAAAGLGGASADAAATLRLLGDRFGVDQDRLLKIGAALGSDIPVLLGPVPALVAGRGEIVTPLLKPAVTVWVVTVTPPIRLAGKTATLYRAMRPVWWGDGLAVESFAASFPSPPVEVPDNVFLRALAEVAPESVAVREALLSAGFPSIHLSGAGPTMYTLSPDLETAERLAAAASGAVRGAIVHVATLHATP